MTITTPRTRTSSGIDLSAARELVRGDRRLDAYLQALLSKKGLHCFGEDPQAFDAFLDGLYELGYDLLYRERSARCFIVGFTPDQELLRQTWDKGGWDDDYNIYTAAPSSVEAFARASEQVRQLAARIHLSTKYSSLLQDLAVAQRVEALGPAAIEVAWALASELLHPALERMSGGGVVVNSDRQAEMLVDFETAIRAVLAPPTLAAEPDTRRSP
jgi:hypothetical protein